MLKIIGYVCITAMAAIGAGGAGYAADPGAGAATPPRRELIYGAEIMTHDEREQYRARMRGAKAPGEEARIRGEHRQAMQKRARERGAKLFEPPAAPGTGK
jgi:hypothetical protein